MHTLLSGLVATVILLLECMALTDGEANCMRATIQLVDTMSAATAQSVAGGAESPAEDGNVNAIANRNLATLAVLKELPVTHVIVDGQVCYQKKYLSTTFDVPKPDANIGPGPFYLITCGCRVGIFSSM